jgi:ribosome recycling factor
MELKEFEDKCQKSINILIDDLSKISANKASAGVLKTVMVQLADGSKCSIPEVALVRVINARTLGVKPWDPSTTPAIEKSIKSLNLTFGIKDDEINVMFPELTQERRKEVAKSINVYALNSKNAIRSIRHDFIKENKKSTKEEEIKFEKDVQKIIDKINIKIDDLIEKKQKEIMQL